MYFKNRLLVPLMSGVALCLSGCSSIDRSSDLQHHALRAGSSNKADVVNAIGLPAKTDKDIAKGLEFWFYSGTSINTSYFIPVPVATAASRGLTTVFYSDIGAKNVTTPDATLQIFVFDRDGRLVDIHKPSTGKKE